MTAGVGADVEALCSKCGDVWHVVVAKVGQQIVKVQCKQCGGYHRFKSVHNAPAEKKLPVTARKAREPGDDAPVKPKASRDPVERFEKPAVAADLSKAVRPYRASEKFAVGERLDHPSFGQGVVELDELGKVTVFFASGRRVLAQAKIVPGEKPGGLERPKPFDHSKPVPGGKPAGNT